MTVIQEIESQLSKSVSHKCVCSLFSDVKIKQFYGFLLIIVVLLEVFFSKMSIFLYLMFLSLWVLMGKTRWVGSWMVQMESPQSLSTLTSPFTVIFPPVVDVNTVVNVIYSCKLKQPCHLIAEATVPSSGSPSICTTEIIIFFNLHSLHTKGN